MAPDSQLQATEEALRQALTRYTEEHPNVVALRGRVERLRELAGSTEAEALVPVPNRRAVFEQRETLRRLRAMHADLNRQIAKLDARIENSAALVDESEALSANEQVLRENVNQYLRLLKEAELSESLERSQQGVRLSLLEPARPPTHPKEPPWLVALVGCAASLGFAALVAVGLELLRPVIVGSAQLEQLLGTRVIGSVPSHP